MTSLSKLDTLDQVSFVKQGWRGFALDPQTDGECPVCVVPAKGDHKGRPYNTACYGAPLVVARFARRILDRPAKPAMTLARRAMTLVAT
jgi:hypothetical protein